MKLKLMVAVLLATFAVQVIGSPSSTAAVFLVNRANRSLVSLIGLTVLSVPAQPGVTKIHAICLEP